MTGKVNKDQHQINCQHLIHAELGYQTNLSVNADFQRSAGET